MKYSLIKPLLFKLDAEKAHYVALNALKTVLKTPFKALALPKALKINEEIELFKLKFPNPVGLAAGFDKNAQYIDELAQLGFGFIEIGTVTPKPQAGNPKPRLFRLVKDRAVINRMGFNNEGVDAAVKRLEKRKSNIIVGGNIGKNKTTPNDKAEEDYKICFEKLFDYVDYFVVNVSSPNTPNLRDLQEKEPLTKLLSTLQNINQGKKTPKPLLLKIAPDLSNHQLDEIIEITQATQLNGLVATNTTISRAGLKTSKQKIEQIGNGGLSGLPVKQHSTQVLRYLKKGLPNLPIIGVGGIMNGQDAYEKIEAGASLVQVYSGFIYAGPNFANCINRYLMKQVNK